MTKSLRFIPSVRPFTKVWDRVTDLIWWRGSFLNAGHWKARWVDVDSLIGTQGWVEIAGVEDARTEEPILVVKIGGKNYIRDGHHRVMRARQDGRKAIPASVLDLGD